MSKFHSVKIHIFFDITAHSLPIASYCRSYEAMGRQTGDKVGRGQSLTLREWSPARTM